MFSIKAVVVASLSLWSLTAFAQTPANFTPSTQQTLYITYANGTVLSRPGEQLPQAPTQVQPNISTTVFSQTSSAVIMMLDPDVVINGTKTLLLQWLATNVTMPGGSNSSLSIPVTKPPGAVYIGPAPPVGPPHNYIFLLFSQPANFSIPSSYGNLTGIPGRYPFPLQKFINQTGLGAPLAANNMLVQNSSTNASATTTTAPVATVTRNAVARNSGPAAFVLAAAGLAALLS